MNIQDSAAGTRRSIASELRRLVLLAVLPLVLLIGALTYANYQEAREDAKGLVLRQAAQVASEVSGFLAQTERALALIARRPGVAKMEPAQCDPRLGDLIAIQPLFLNISTLDRTGRIVCSTEFPADGSRAINVSESKAFVGAMAGQPLTLGAVRKGRAGTLWVAFAATPVRTPGGEVAGAVVVAINLAGWLAPASSSRLHPDTVIGAVEKGGRVALQQPEPGQWIGRNASSFESFAQAMRTVDGTFVAPGPQGIDRVWAVKPIPHTDWFAFAGVKADTVFSAARRNAWGALALALAALLASIWAAARASRRLTSPMADLAAVAERVGGGASVRASPSGPAEVATVAVEFNRMLEKREASETRFRDFANASADWFWETDAEGRYTWISGALETSIGRPPSDFIGRTRTEIAVEGGIDLSAEPWRSHLQTLARHEPFRNFVSHHVTPGEVWLSVSGVPRFDADGHFLGYRAITSNITAQVRHERQAQAALQASEVRYRALVDSLPEPVFVHRNGLLVYLNAEATKVFGATRAEDLIGTPILERVHPEFRNIVTARARQIAEEGKTTALLEHKFLKLDGTPIEVETQGTPIQFDGQPAILIVGRDISMRRAAEAKLDEARDLSLSIMESVAAQIAVLDRDGTIIAVNEAWRRFAQDNGLAAGQPAPNTVIGSNYLSACRTEPEFEMSAEAKLSRDGIVAVLGGELPEFALEYPCHSPSEKRWLSMSVTPLKSGTGGVVIAHSNITQRVLAQEALRAADRRYQYILSYLHGAILLVGEDGRVEYCNQEFTRMFALDMRPEDLTGLGAREALERISMSYRDPSAGRARVEAIVADGNPVTSELVHLTGDRSVLRDFAPIAVGGHQLGRLWHHQDISELARTQSDLAKRSRHLQLILDAMPGPVVHHDLQRRYTFANRPFSELFGRPLQDVIGRTTGEILGDKVYQVVQPLAERAWRGEHVRYEREHVMPDGSKHDLLVHTLPDINERGEIQGLISLTLDVSEQRRAERTARLSQRRLADVVATVDGIFWEADAQTLVFTSVSPTAERLLGYPTADWLVPGFWAGHIHPEDRDATLALCALHTQALENHDFEYRFIAADGRIVWLRDQVTVVARDGKPGLLRGLMTDISERKRSEAARASLEIQLRETQKMAAIGTLAGGIAHDFNNILAAILGNADLAHEDARGDRALEESLDEIRKAGLRGRDLVKQILAFSRRQPTERKSLDLAAVVEDAARLLRVTLPARIALEVHCSPGLPPALADATQIEQVILNLVTNAMQAMQGSPGRMLMALDAVELSPTLSATRPALHRLLATHPGHALRLMVKDDGPGMPADVLERIFEPFFTTKPVGEGTGLGLAVVHGIVENHEGAIEVESTPGAGTTFTLYLPCADPFEAEATETSASSRFRETASGSRVLYIDDDEALVTLVTRLLERRGFRVSAHTNQKAALAALRTDPAAFDLVVTDYNMPGMSGLDVARAVRAIRPGLPVAVASGFVDETLTEQAAEAGVREVIFKAISVDDYCAALQRMIQSAGSASAH